MSYTIITKIIIIRNFITKDISKVLKIDLLESEKLKKTLNETDVTFSDVTEDQISDKKLNKEEFKDLLNKIIYARIEEIISMSFKNNFFFNFLKNDEKSILIFTGEGSKILNKNSIYLKEEFNISFELTLNEPIRSSRVFFVNIFVLISLASFACFSPLVILVTSKASIFFASLIS